MPVYTLQTTNKLVIVLSTSTGTPNTAHYEYLYICDSVLPYMCLLCLLYVVGFVSLLLFICLAHLTITITNT